MHIHRAWTISTQRGLTMETPERASAQEVRQKVQQGLALLVCAYQNIDKFTRNHLDGALSFDDFQKRLSRVPRDQEIFIYCA